MCVYTSTPSSADRSDANLSRGSEAWLNFFTNDSESSYFSMTPDDSVKILLQVHAYRFQDRLLDFASVRTTKMYIWNFSLDQALKSTNRAMVFFPFVESNSFYWLSPLAAEVYSLLLE